MPKTYVKNKEGDWERTYRVNCITDWAFWLVTVLAIIATMVLAYVGPVCST